ncbi:MAG: flagellar hook-length control protein FliK [Planctomycetes bacterium]|nr:flagellar hook-length control protein FliK [Planctomycetota bacterium]MBI3843043.1 flagellar hook-length control protein FliK [Planctomycetota bacterium]
MSLVASPGIAPLSQRTGEAPRRTGKATENESFENGLALLLATPPVEAAPSTPSRPAVGDVTVASPTPPNVDTTAPSGGDPVASDAQEIPAELAPDAPPASKASDAAAPSSPGPAAPSTIVGGTVDAATFGATPLSSTVPSAKAIVATTSGLATATGAPALQPSKAATLSAATVATVPSPRGTVGTAESLGPTTAGASSTIQAAAPESTPVASPSIDGDGDANRVAAETVVEPEAVLTGAFGVPAGVLLFAAAAIAVPQPSLVPSTTDFSNAPSSKALLGTAATTANANPSPDPFLQALLASRGFVLSGGATRASAPEVIAPSSSYTSPSKPIEGEGSGPLVATTPSNGRAIASPTLTPADPALTNPAKGSDASTAQSRELPPVPSASSSNDSTGVAPNEANRSNPQPTLDTLATIATIDSAAASAPSAEAHPAAGAELAPAVPTTRVSIIGRANPARTPAASGPKSDAAASTTSTTASAKADSSRPDPAAGDDSSAKSETPTDADDGEPSVFKSAADARTHAASATPSKLAADGKVEVPLAAAADAAANAVVAPKAVVPAAAAPPSAPPAAPAPIPAEVLESLQFRVERSVDSIRLVLDPPELGRVRVHVTSDGTSFTAAVQVERPEVAQALSARLPELERALSQAGLKVDHVAIASFDGGSGADSFAGAFDRTDRREHAPGHRALPGASRAGARYDRQGNSPARRGATTLDYFA